MQTRWARHLYESARVGAPVHGGGTGRAVVQKACALSDPACLVERSIHARRVRRDRGPARLRHAGALVGFALFCSARSPDPDHRRSVRVSTRAPPRPTSAACVHAARVRPRACLRAYTRPHVCAIAWPAADVMWRAHGTLTRPPTAPHDSTTLCWRGASTVRCSRPWAVCAPCRMAHGSAWRMAAHGAWRVTGQADVIVR